MRIAVYPGAYGGGISVIGGGLAAALPNVREIGWVFVAIGVLIVLWGIRIDDKHLWQPWWRRKPAASVEWEPTESEIREECAAHGWPRHEPYLTEARDHLIFDHEFNRLNVQKKDSAS